jgi:hypothetical protein
MKRLCELSVFADRYRQEINPCLYHAILNIVVERLKRKQ